jgi:hypothetical protein
MQNQLTGEMVSMNAETAGILRRIFGAGGFEAPIFVAGDCVEIRGGYFEVVALDHSLLVLRGIPFAHGAQRAQDQAALREGQLA